MNYNIEFIKSAKNQEPINQIIDEYGPNEETEIKPVFRPFLSEENVKPKLNLKKISNNANNTKSNSKKRNELYNKIKKDKSEFKSYFKIKNTIFNQIKLDKPEALKKLEKGLKVVFFGKEGYITKKLDSLKKIYKKRRNSIGIDTKIYAGTLDFLDLKSKNSMGGRLDDYKKNYLFRSNNFSVARDKFGRREAMFIANNSKKRKIQKNVKRLFSAQNNQSPFITDYKNKNYINEYTIKLLKANFNTISTFSSIPQSAKTNKTQLKTENKTNKSMNNRTRKKNRNEICKTLEINENKDLYSTYEYHNCKSDLYSPISSPETIKIKKEIKKTKRQLSERIKTMEFPMPELEGELYEIIERTNLMENEDMQKENFKTQKLKEDIYIITGIKLPENKKQTPVKKLVQESLENKDIRQKKALKRFTKGLKNMDEETALKCVEEFTPYTPKKTFKKLDLYKPKKVVEEKYIPDDKLRIKCVENDKKMERLAFSLDKLKVKYDL